MTHAMRESEGDLAVYQEVEIPPDMQRDLVRERWLDDIDAPPGANRQAARRVYARIWQHFTQARAEGRELTRTEVQAIYDNFRRDAALKPGREAAQFTLTHVLLRGLYQQVWCEREEELGLRYHTLVQVNILIDRTIQGQAWQEE
jgi:hypothetical protein